MGARESVGRRAGTKKSRLAYGTRERAGSGEVGPELKVGGRGGEESAAATKMSHIHPPLLRGTRKCKYEPTYGIWDGTGTASE